MNQPVRTSVSLPGNGWIPLQRFPLKLTVLINDPNRPGIVEIVVDERDDFRKIFDDVAHHWRRQTPFLNIHQLYYNYYFEYLDSQLSQVHVYTNDWDQKFSHINRYICTELPLVDTIRLHSIRNPENQFTNKIDRLVGISIESLIAGDSREVQHFIHTVNNYCSLEVASLNIKDDFGKLLRENPSDLLDNYPAELLQADVTVFLCDAESSVSESKQYITVRGSTLADDLCQQATHLLLAGGIGVGEMQYILKLKFRHQYLIGQVELVKHAWLYEGGNPWLYVNNQKSIVTPPLVLVTVHKQMEILHEQIYMALPSWPQLEEEEASSPHHSHPHLSQPGGNSKDLSNLIHINSLCSYCPVVNRRGEKYVSVAMPNYVEHRVTVMILFYEIVGWSKDKRTKTKFGLRACVYQADRRLCPPVETEIHQGINVEFDLFISQLPRSARLCMVVFHNHQPIAWANICLFDFELNLQNGKINLVFWPYEDSKEKENDSFKPLGTVMPNIHAEGCPKMIILPCHQTEGKHIHYPDYIQSVHLASQHFSPQEGSCQPNAEETEQINVIWKKSPLCKYLCDYGLLWKFRYYIMQIEPDSLPKIIEAVDWRDQVQVCKLYSLLKGWPNDTTAVNVALELLDCKFTDEVVRHFAVSILSKQLSHRELSLYLPQLVQALKYENYLDSYLAKFLLSKAISNRHFGQALFYYLRCEMHIPSVSVRFGILLAAYLRACPGRLDVLVQQLNAAARMNVLSRSVREMLIKSGGKTGGMTALTVEFKQSLLKHFRSELKKSNESIQISQLVSPLEPDVLLQTVIVENCRFFDSKMIPLMFSWKLTKYDAEHKSIIYKCGDDLRQDILTLQIFNVMQDLWLKEGLLLSLRPYRVIALNASEGFIEVVPNSITLSALQQKRGMGKESVLDWLMENNEKSNHAEVIARFTRTFGAYCVACYVLGLGDRHSDNIMISHDGTFFHIDFGHFLGNFKKFVGIPRENMRFLLMPEFLYVVSNGEKGKDKIPAFEKLCRQGFLSLRRQSNLLVTMFLMMANTGIPQLSSPNSLKYLENTLGMKLTEKEALENFQKKWDTSKSREVLTRLDWKIHNERRPQ